MLKLSDFIKGKLKEKLEVLQDGILTRFMSSLIVTVFGLLIEEREDGEDIKERLIRDWKEVERSKFDYGASFSPLINSHAKSEAERDECHLVIAQEQDKLMEDAEHLIRKLLSVTDEKDKKDEDSNDSN